MFNPFHGFFLLFMQLQFFFLPNTTFFPKNFPIATPISQPTATPSAMPSATPTVAPSSTPSPVLSPSPSPTPLVSPSPTPVGAPDLDPTASPSATPTATPSSTPSASPSATPTPSPTPTASASPSPTPTPEPIGNDISYPQCNKSYPVGQLFGIVGVNGGLASTSNPCLSSELTWAASTASSSANQAKIQLYVNTGNPGGLNTVTWPQNNSDPQGNLASNPHGTCDGSNSIACAWQYGWNRAVDDVVSRFTPAAIAAGISSDPANYPWWLDVETANSWREGSDEALQANVADLEGMVAYFKSRGISPGLYSTSFQWGIIVGNLSSDSSLNGLPNWLPGASTLEGAKANCQKSPFTAGSLVTLTQYTTEEFDYDYSCK